MFGLCDLFGICSLLIFFSLRFVLHKFHIFFPMIHIIIRRNKASIAYGIKELSTAGTAGTRGISWDNDTASALPTEIVRSRLGRVSSGPS